MYACIVFIISEFACVIACLFVCLFVFRFVRSRRSVYANADAERRRWLISCRSHLLCVPAVSPTATDNTLNVAAVTSHATPNLVAVLAATRALDRVLSAFVG